MRSIQIAAVMLLGLAGPALADAEGDALIALERQRSAAIAAHEMGLMAVERRE